MLNIRLTETEYERLRTRSQLVGLSPTAVARRAVTGLQVQPLQVPETNWHLYGELNRLGNNLNQLLVLIYTNRAPLGLLSTLRAILELHRELKFLLLGETPGSEEREAE